MSSFNEREKGLHQLKTFSWDNQESEGHFENIYERNLSKLQWPEDTSDFDSWRSKWSSAFTTPHRYVITTSKQLSKELARFATKIRDVIPEILGDLIEEGLQIRGGRSCAKSSIWALSTSKEGRMSGLYFSSPLEFKSLS